MRIHEVYSESECFLAGKEKYFIYFLINMYI